MKYLTPKNIWLAGLGALSRAEREGGQWLSELMADGEQFEAQKKAELDKILQEMTDQVQKEQRRAKHEIEKSFENKVSGTLNALGLASRQELNDLMSRLEVLEKKLNKTNP